MAAAADIVAFAQLRDAAEADAILAASADEDLTDEEESAVAEIERLLFLDEPSPAADQASAAAQAIRDGSATANEATGRTRRPRTGEPRASRPTRAPNTVPPR